MFLFDGGAKCCSERAAGPKLGNLETNQGFLTASLPVAPCYHSTPAGTASFPGSVSSLSLSLLKLWQNTLTKFNHLHLNHS